MTTYKTKAIKVEAIQVTEENRQALPKWAMQAADCNMLWPNWWIVRAGQVILVMRDDEFRALFEVTP